MISALELHSEPVGRGERSEPSSSRHAARCAAASRAWRGGDSRQARTLSPADPSSFASPHLHQIFTAGCPALDARTFLKPPSSPSSPHHRQALRDEISRTSSLPAAHFPVRDSERGPLGAPHPLSPLPTPWWGWGAPHCPRWCWSVAGCAPHGGGVAGKPPPFPFCSAGVIPAAGGWGPPGPAPPVPLPGLTEASSSWWQGQARPAECGLRVWGQRGAGRGAPGSRDPQI